MELTEREVQQGLQALYDPGRRSLRIGNVSLLGTGYETDVFAFSREAVAGEGAGGVQDLVLRVYGGEGTAEKARREFAVMDRLYAAGYPVPRVLGRTRDPSPFGGPYLIMERIHGVSLGLSYWGVPVDQREASHTVLCRLMVVLHALEGSTILPHSPLAHSPDPYGFIDHEIAMLSDLVSRLEGTEPPSFREILAWLIAHRATVPCERPSVIHGDFHPGNVLVRADGSAVVIDWSNVRLGDYRMDIAWPRLITRSMALPDGGARELRIYERMAGKAISQIEYFEVIAATKLLLSDLISLTFGAARQGMRPGVEAGTRKDPSLTRYIATLLQERTGVMMTDFDDALTALLTR
jgi:aminoglycoside phosphotransferase (APT) family kinase protein